MPDLDGLPFKKEIINGRQVLAPSAMNSDDWLLKYKAGTEVMMTGRKPRNIHHHNLLFAALKLVVDRTDIWPNTDTLLIELKDATGLSVRRVNALVDQSLPENLQFLVNWLRAPHATDGQAKRALEAAAQTIETLYAKTLETQIHGSISFVAMNQDAFSIWFDRAIHVLATQVMGCEDQALIDEVLAMVSDSDRQKWRNQQQRRVEHARDDAGDGPDRPHGSDLG